MRANSSVYVEEGREYLLALTKELIDRVEYIEISFNEIARVSGVNVATVSRVMNGECVPTFPVLYALYKVIGTELKLGGI